MKRALTPEEATKLIDTCNDILPIDLRDRALIVVGLETGMLCMSLAAMRLETIKNCDVGYPIAPVPIKGSKKLYPVPLSDTAIAALAPWRAWLRSQKIIQGPVFCPLSRRVARGGKLVYEPDGTDQPMSRITIYKAIVRRAKKARLRGVSPLLFRGTFIAWRMEAGLPPYKIASITGHRMSDLAGMSSFSEHIDPMVVGAEARRATPAWLTKLVRGN